MLEVLSWWIRDVMGEGAVNTWAYTCLLCSISRLILFNIRGVL